MRNLPKLCSFLVVGLFLHVKTAMCCGYSSDCTRQGISVPFTIMCSPLSFTKKERKEERDKPVTMTNAGKRERGVDGIFTGLLHFFHSGG